MNTMRSPRVIIFDVNETLSDMAPMSARFADVGAAEHLFPTWFAGVLRDGFALAVAGTARPFAEVGTGVLEAMLSDAAIDRELGDAVDHIMAGFAELEVHPDVIDGVNALAALDIRLITLSNGSASLAQSLLERAGVRSAFESLLSVEDAGRWKPHADAYRYALDQCGVEPGDAMLVAVHPWDIDGAHRAGLSTAWLDRENRPYPDHFVPADVHAPSLPELARVLGERGGDR